MARYGSNLSMLYETPMLRVATTEEIHRDRVERILSALLAARRTQLTKLEAKEILYSYGIQVADTPVCLDAAAGSGRRMISANGVELFLAKRIDPDFGSMIVFGPGGRLAEVWQDRAIGSPPLNATLAKHLMERPRIYAALRGFSSFQELVVEHTEPEQVVSFAALLGCGLSKKTPVPFTSHKSAGICDR